MVVVRVETRKHAERRRKKRNETENIASAGKHLRWQARFVFGTNAGVDMIIVTRLMAGRRSWLVFH